MSHFVVQIYTKDKKTAEALENVLNDVMLQQINPFNLHAALSALVRHLDNIIVDSLAEKEYDDKATLS